jgi:hypothetical protein
MKAASAIALAVGFFAAGAASARTSSTGFGKFGPAGFQPPATPAKPGTTLTGAYRPPGAAPAPAARPGASLPPAAAATFKPYKGMSTYGTPKGADDKAKKPPGYVSTY